MSIEKILLIALAVGVMTAAGTYVVDSFQGVGDHTSTYDGKVGEVEGLSGFGLGS